MTLADLVVKVVPPGHFEVHSWDPHSDQFFPCGAHLTPPPLSTITTADSRGPRDPDPDISLRLRDGCSHLAIWAGADWGLVNAGHGRGEAGSARWSRVDSCHLSSRDSGNHHAVENTVPEDSGGDASP